MRGERVTAALVGAFALVLYTLTAYRTLPGGDSGELIGAVASGGVIHPPGYPLYAIFGRIFLALPSGSLAFRLNLLSAVGDALAAYVLTRAVARATESLAGGLFAGVLFAFAPGIWRYAIAAEVFALNNLGVALLLWLAVLFAETKERRFAVLGALVLGLGLANHQTIVFTGIPVVVYALAAYPRILLTPRTALELVAAGLAGLLPYLVLPVLASHHAFVSWGDADTWDGFWTHVLRREYGTFQLSPAGVGADVPASRVFAAFWSYETKQAPWWMLAFALPGSAVCLRRLAQRPRTSAVLAVAPLLVSVGVMVALGNLPLETELFQGILARFWQQPHLYVSVLSGVGLTWVLSFAERHSFASKRSVERAGLLLASLFGATEAAMHYAALDHHGSHLVEDYAAEMLRVAPEGAIVFTKGDLITNGIRYAMLAHHVRPDVRVVDQELLATSWGEELFEKNAPRVVFPGSRLSLDPRRGYQLKQLFDANRHAPMMVCGGTTPGDRSAEASYGLWPSGFCDDVHSGTEAVSLDEWLARSEDNLPRVNFGGQKHEPGTWEGVVWSDYWEVRQSRAAHLLTVAGSNPSRHKYIPIAASILQQIVDENPDVPAHVHKNLAVAIGRAGIATDEQRKQAIAAWEGYLKVAPPGDAQLTAIRAELRRLHEPRTSP